MENSSTDPEPISIRCPDCGQRFKVGPDLKDKMVECGSCDHRFRVTDEVVERRRKFYPGEHHDPSLRQFARVPMKEAPMPTFRTIDPPPMDDQSAPEPLSPLRGVLGLAGVAVALAMALLLMFGGSPGGVLDGAPMDKRLVLAAFGTVLAGILLGAANPRTRGRAIGGTVVIAALLFSLPIFFTEGLPEDRPVSGGTLAESPVNDEPTESEPQYADLKHEVGYGKLAEALGQYGEDGVANGRTVYGVWLRGLRLSHKQQVEDYLIRQTSAGGESWIYSRPPSDYLLILDRVAPGIEAVAELCRRFGEVKRTWPELHLIEVEVDGQAFVQGPMKKLQDPEDPSFYELNRRELESIDLNRVSSAVKRLVSAEPRLYRSDIVDRLQELIVLGDDELKSDAARALAVWAEDGDGSVKIVRDVARDFFERKQTVPRSLVEFLVENRDEESLDLLHELWRSDMSEWEAQYGDLGSMIEDDVLAALAELKPIEKFSAIRLLRRVGTAKSLPHLEAERRGAVPEMNALISQAIEAIENP